MPKQICFKRLQIVSFKTGPKDLIQWKNKLNNVSELFQHYNVLIWTIFIDVGKICFEIIVEHKCETFSFMDYKNEWCF